ncbi:unnamed protein product [Dracunculus medinensis]|uniref:Nuf2 domain-containing protein n=1 Tax=Dracunculus medinensis TaxID=318479 RepID=A0A0N4UKI1_DRAME|nr:unnamed protein product [Dracunculus medinensis]
MAFWDRRSSVASINCGDRLKSSTSPLFDVAFIVDSLNSFIPSLALTVSDITLPVSDKICQIYASVSQFIFGVPENIFTIPPFNAAPDSDPEMFSKTIPKLVIYKVLSSLIGDCTAGLGNFSLNDLLGPTERSVRHILTLLIDYIIFLQEMNKQVDAVFGLVDAKKNELTVRERQIILLENEVAQVDTNLKNQKELQDQVREEKQINSKNFEEICSANELLKQQCKTNTTLITESAMMIASFFLLNEMQKEYDSLNLQNEILITNIVSSPDRLKIEVSTLEKQLAKHEEERESKENEYAKLMDKHKVLLLNEQLICKLINRLKGLSSSESDMCNKSEKLNKYNKKDAEDKIELKSLAMLMKEEESKTWEALKSFDWKHKEYSGQLRHYRELLSTTEEQINAQREWYQNIDIENMKYQRDLAKIKDERATFYRSAENESLKLVVRLNAADQKVREEANQCFEELKRLRDIIAMIKEAFDIADEQSN